MDEIAKQGHQQRVDAVNNALTRVLAIVTKYGLTEGHKLVGDHKSNLPVTIELFPQGSMMGAVKAENGPVVKITKGKKGTADIWMIERDPAKGNVEVFDTAKIENDTFYPGKIHFFRKATSCVESAEDLEASVQAVSEWFLEK